MMIDEEIRTEVREMTDSPKGVLIQRDEKRHAVVTRMPDGIETPDDVDKRATRAAICGAWSGR